jgi:hypothetical protein
LVCVLPAQGQSLLTIHDLNYRQRISESAIYGLDHKTNHSSILPLINYTILNVSGETKKDVKPQFSLYPLVNLGSGIEIAATTRFLYDAGLGAGLDYQSERVFASLKVLPYLNRSPIFSDSIQHNLKMGIGTSRPITESLYLQQEFIVGLKANKFFTFLGGYGKNSFGEGYRSLLLSDNANPYPFLKLETKFSNVKYVNLYNVWRDNTVDPSNRSLDRKKFSAIHYLSWNITREFNISIFESVVWQAKDSIVNRGFDPNYLNPVVFYRPVEYANGSADNVLLGLNTSFKFDKHQSLYAQLILDEFLLAELRSDQKWWGNKYGVQFGYKSNSFFNEHLYFQAEFNMVRPFTYSHKYSTQSYGHLNMPVTHPIGANFYEVLQITAFQKGRLQLTNKLTYASYGTDTSAINYGQNIFNSYTDRADDYNQITMQGNKKNVLNESLIIEYQLSKIKHVYLFMNYNLRLEYNRIQNQHSNYFILGIRSRIWNNYTDF